MLCDNCKKNTATTYVKHTVNGVTTELHLCGECAASHGVNGSFGLDFGDFWGSLFAEPAKRLRDDSLRCADCGRSFREIAAAGRPGCPTCYTTFYDRLLPSIQRIHGKTQHTGKTSAPVVDTKVQELKQLREQLEQCIANQEYETCVELRDRIRKLEGGEEQ